MPRFETEEELEGFLSRFALPEPSHDGDTALLADAGRRASALAAELLEERLLRLARVLDVLGLPLLGLLAERAAGREVSVHVVLI
jgi:hypothetical protein